MFICNLFDIIYLYNDLRSWLPFSYALAAVLPSTNMLVSSANITCVGLNCIGLSRLNLIPDKM